MTVTASQLFPNATYSNSLGSSAAALYDCPGRTLSRITGFAGHNYGTDVETVTLYLVATAGSPTDANILTAFDILPGTPFAWSYSKIIPDGQSLFGKCSHASKVNLFVDGTEETGTVAT